MPNRSPHPGAHPARRGGLLRFTFLSAAVLLLGFAGPVPARQADPPPPTPDAVLLAQGSTPDQRLEAATQLLQLSQNGPALSPVLEVLIADPTGGEAARALLLALSRQAVAPPSALAPTLAIARDPAGVLRVEAVRALAAFRSREAAAALVELAAQNQPPPVRDAAFRSLAQLTGRDDLGPSAGAWREWLEHVLDLSERQWEQELLLSQIRRAQRLEAGLVEGDRRLVEAWRQIHLLTPLDARSTVLARLLMSDTPVLRDLGFELVNREIGESRTLQPAVAQTATELLVSTDPLVRSQAALLLHRLAPPEAEGPVLAALDRETDPRAADALLLAASRWPSPVEVRPVLRWLEGPPSVRVRAAATAWALMRAGYLEADADRQAVLAAVRSLDTASLTGPACRLLATLGSEEDLARLRSLVEGAEEAVRVTAADALGLRPDQVEFLLGAASSDPTIFEAVARAVRAHQHDARGYSALTVLPAPSPQTRARVLAEYAAELSTEDLVRLAELVSDPADVVPLLTPLTTADRLGVAEQAPHLADGLLILARAHLALGNPGDALNALSLIPVGHEPATADQLNDLRATLLLWLNRIDQAYELHASADAWLDALEYAVAEPHAEVIATRFLERFDDNLTEEQQARFDSLRRRLSEVEKDIENGGG